MEAGGPWCNLENRIKIGRKGKKTGAGRSRTYARRPQQISSLSFGPPEQISSLLPCRSATAPCWRCLRFVECMLHFLCSNWYVFPTIATSPGYFQPWATRPLVGASDYCTSCSHRFHITEVYHSNLVTHNGPMVVRLLNESHINEANLPPASKPGKKEKCSKYLPNA